MEPCQSPVYSKRCFTTLIRLPANHNILHLILKNLLVLCTPTPTTTTTTTTKDSRAVQPASSLAVQPASDSIGRIPAGQCCCGPAAGAVAGTPRCQPTLLRSAGAVCTRNMFDCHPRHRCAEFGAEVDALYRWLQKRQRQRCGGCRFYSYVTGVVDIAPCSMSRALVGGTAAAAELDFLTDNSLATFGAVP